MTEVETGGLAFPFNACEFGYEPSRGMTLRDYFAGQALVGLVAHVQLNVAAVKAYEVADAMIAARTKDSAQDGGAS